MFKENRESIALFGGSFDPPHLGHKSIIEALLKVLKINRIFVIPTFLNPFKQSSYFTAKERLLYCKKFFSSYECVAISDYEVKQNKPVATVETLKYFQQKYNVNYVVIGADNLENIEKWKDFEYLNAQITWVLATRKGYALKTDKLRDFKILEVNVELSSTQIRNNMTKESE